MTVSDILERARQAGIALIPDGGSIIVRGPESPFVRGLIRQHKTAVLNALVLEERLNAGWVLCKADMSVDKRQHMEDHWISLLHQYEHACDVDLSPITRSEAA